jgi:hypothetical protein
MDNIARLASLLQRSSALMQFFASTANEIASMLNRIGKLQAVEVSRDIDGYLAIIEGTNGKLRVKVVIEVEEAVRAEGG